MNLQLNVLKKNELRYQGLLTVKMMVVGSVSILVAVLLLIFSSACIVNVALQAKLKHTRDEWVQMEPEVTVARAQLNAKVLNRQAEAALDKWSNRTGAPAYKILRELQKHIPDQMELSRLYMGLIQSGSTGNPECKLQLSGRVEGKELLTVKFKQSLNESESVKSFCGDVRLISSSRESDTSWLFSFEGKRIIREAP